MTNENQIASWDGHLGTHWVAERDRYSRMLEPFVDPLLAAASPATGDRVLDVGCGNGDITLACAARVGPSGEALGIDISGPMLEHATRRASDASIGNVSFLRADAQQHAFSQPLFDLAVSRFGIMFFDDPIAAFTNLASALRPGGQMVFSCWQEMLSNDWIAVPVTAALDHVPVPTASLEGPGPFSLSATDEVRRVLFEAGLTDIQIRSINPPMYIGSSVDDTVAFMHNHEFGEVLFRDIDDATAARAWDAVADSLRPYETPDGVFMTGKAWIVSAMRPH